MTLFINMFGLRSDLPLTETYYPEAEGINCQLPVENIYQYPDLPNGCEATALAICMNYRGYPVDKNEIADNYMPTVPRWNDVVRDPNFYYMGDPHIAGGRGSGFYCLPNCVCLAVENYNESNGTEITYADLTGHPVSDLYELVGQGYPVMVWATQQWNEPIRLRSGLFQRMHCVVLSGYTNATVTIKDPIYGETIMDRYLFENRWIQQGSYAVVIY